VATEHLKAMLEPTADPWSLVRLHERLAVFFFFFWLTSAFRVRSTTA
jgi:hypothetical protein